MPKRETRGGRHAESGCKQLLCRNAWTGGYRLREERKWRSFCCAVIAFCLYGMGRGDDFSLGPPDRSPLMYREYNGGDDWAPTTRDGVYAIIFGEWWRRNENTRLGAVRATGA